MAFRSKMRGTTENQFDVGTQKVTLDSTAVSVPWNFKFPVNAGTNGYVLQTDGAGNLVWAAVGAASDNTTPYYIPVGETFVNNINRQNLFHATIVVDGTLEVNGLLIEV